MEQMINDFWQNKRCLVTGGYGFGGSHLCEQILAKGARVYILDREAPRSSYLVLSGIADRVHYICGGAIVSPAGGKYQRFGIIRVSHCLQDRVGS